MGRQVIPMKKREVLTVYAIGSIGYRMIEVLWRGRTHWTMGICGGVCFLFIYVSELVHRRRRLAARALISTVWVTAVEFFSGLLINRVFRLGVWDYSGMRFNLCGQISLHTRASSVQNNKAPCFRRIADGKAALYENF